MIGTLGDWPLAAVLIVFIAALAVNAIVAQFNRRDDIISNQKENALRNEIAKIENHNRDLYGQLWTVRDKIGLPHTERNLRNLNEG